MPGGQYIALSALRTRMQQLDQLADDLSNVHASGYRGGRTVQEAVAREEFEGALRTAVDTTGGAFRLDMTKGTIEPTGRDLDVAIFVHPASPLVGQERLTRYYFPLIVGNPLETALAISKLIFGGVLERLPDLRICFAHGGGAFPFTLARLNHGWHVRPEGPQAIPKEPREYARRIFVDSLTLAPRNLRFIVEELGAERVMIGSDYPFDMGDNDPRASLDAAALDPATRRLIEGETAARFLRLPAA